MNVLFVCRADSRGEASPFVNEQARSLRDRGIHTDVLAIDRGGVSGYWAARAEVARKASGYDIVHGHGLMAVAATGVTACATVATFHGSEVADPRTRGIAAWVAHRVDAQIYVSDALRDTALYAGTNSYVVPCGVDVDLFAEGDRDEARRQLGWPLGEPTVLFGGSFDRPVKNSALAMESVKLWSGATLRELSGMSRAEVATAMNASDVLLLTSHREGDPQVVKEAMACGLPVVSVDVGDLQERLRSVTASEVVSRDPRAIADALQRVAGVRTNGREVVASLSTASVAERLETIYREVQR